MYVRKREGERERERENRDNYFLQVLLFADCWFVHFTGIVYRICYLKIFGEIFILEFNL